MAATTGASPKSQRAARQDPEQVALVSLLPSKILECAYYLAEQYCACEFRTANDTDVISIVVIRQPMRKCSKSPALINCENCVVSSGTIYCIHCVSQVYVTANVVFDTPMNNGSGHIEL